MNLLLTFLFLSTVVGILVGGRGQHRREQQIIWVAAGAVMLLYLVFPKRFM